MEITYIGILQAPTYTQTLLPQEVIFLWPRSWSSTTAIIACSTNIVLFVLQAARVKEHAFGHKVVENLSMLHTDTPQNTITHLCTFKI